MRVTGVFSLILLALQNYVTQALATPSCPTKIKTMVSDSSFAGDDLVFSTMDTIHELLLKCPNITDLDLRVSATGCTEHPDRYNFPFNPLGGDKYPSLRSVRLEGYEFGHKQREPWHLPTVRHPWGRDYFVREMNEWISSENWKIWMNWKTAPEAQQRKSNLELWMDAMDWGNVEELMIAKSGPEYRELLPGRLHSLRSLESTDLAFIEALPDNTLKSITWIGRFENEVLPSIVSHQGASLESLEIRVPEMYDKSFPGVQNFSMITSLPNLTHMSIDMPRNGTWPMNKFKQVASMEKLRSMEIYLNIQSTCRQSKPSIHGFWDQRDWDKFAGKGYCEGEDQFMRPFLDEGNATLIFETIIAHKKGVSLDNATFYIGDWSRPWDGPLYFPPWLENRRAKVVCTAERKSSDSQSPCVVQTGMEYWNEKRYWRDLEDEWHRAEEEYDRAHGLL